MNISKPIQQQVYALMRFSFFQILIAMVFSSLVVAHDISAQELLDRRISLNATNKSVKFILKEIEQQLSVSFTFPTSLVSDQENVSLSVDNAKLSDVLDKLFDRDVEYHVFKNRIILRYAKRTSLESANSSSSFEMLTLIDLSGTVFDEAGQPLPGVNVLEKGTSNGTTTDVNGNFRIDVASGSSVLVFSFIGYSSQEVAVGNKTTFSISLEPNAQSLEEVVVVAYGTQQKKDLSSAITSLKAQDLGNLPVSSADALLQGKAAGVQVVQNAGQPGGEVFVRIRGSSSILGEGRPLYVIDGVPMTNIDAQPLGGGGQRYSGLADINPNDIESMEILKDAAATALYGSRGSNGVVLITTKKGKSGDARISFDTYYGLQQVSKKFDMLNGAEYVGIINESRVNRGQPVFSESILDTTGINTDWQDEVFRTAPMASYNLSITGGTDRLTSFVSLGFFDQSGTLIGQEFSRINGRLNLDYQAKEYLKIGTSTSFTSSDIDHVDADFSDYSVFANALFSNPNFAPRNPDGTYTSSPLVAEGWRNIENPVMIANDLEHNITNRRLITNIYGELSFLKKFRFRTTFGIDLLNRREERFIPSYFVKANGSATSAARFFEELVWQNENTLIYSDVVGKHSFSALVGYSALESTASNFNISGTSTASDLITTFGAANINPPNHDLGSWGLASFFARANYSFDDRYLLELSMRRDGSSRFGKNNRFGYFPAVSAGWRIIAEPFMSNLQDKFTDLKIRGSYGVTGNQDGISNFGSQTLYSGGALYNGRPAIFKSSVANPDLEWETTISGNIGLDVAVYNGRVEMSIDAYQKTTKNLFYPYFLPQSTGFSQIQRVNLGDLENKGVEIMLTTRNLVGAFSWTTNFNIAFNRNKVTQLSGLGLNELRLRPVSLDGVEGPVIRIQEGEPIGNFFGYQLLGVFGNSEYPSVPEGYETNRFGLGDPAFLDVDGNQRFNRDIDQVLIGNALPLHTGGMTNSFSYKGIDLMVLMNWSFGNDIYNLTRQMLESTSRERNQLTTLRDRWTPENSEASIPRVKFQAPSPKSDGNSAFIEDGSFLRIRNITLGYTLSSAFLQRYSISSARIYLSGQNLFTFTNYSGLDPESQNLSVASSNNANATPSLGIDFLTQPIPRVYTLGVNISF